MNAIGRVVGKILGLAFAALVVCYTAVLTFQLAARLTPGNVALQAMVLILFDGAALTWFVMFTTQAKSTGQWAVSAVGFLVGIIGTVIMAAGELILGQSLVTVADPSQLGWILVCTVIVAALAHASLVYAFHFLDPDTKNRIENSQAVSHAVERAYADARSEIARNMDTLTAGLVQSVLEESTQQIAASTARHVRNTADLEAKTGEILRGGAVIDGKAQESQSPAPAEFSHNGHRKPETATYNAEAMTPPLAVIESEGTG